MVISANFYDYDFTSNRRLLTIRSAAVYKDCLNSAACLCLDENFLATFSVRPLKIADVDYFKIADKTIIYYCRHLRMVRV